jgi:hypothetical protein
MEGTPGTFTWRNSPPEQAHVESFLFNAETFIEDSYELGGGRVANAALNSTMISKRK